MNGNSSLVYGQSLDSGILFHFFSSANIIIIIINKVLIKVTLNKVIAGALYIVICG